MEKTNQKNLPSGSVPLKPIPAILVFLLFILLFSCLWKKDIPNPKSSIRLVPYKEEGQTSIYRADISGIPEKRMKTIVLRDSSSSGGSDGIYTGFDIDFILLDIDGDLATKEDQIKPFEDARTQITPGTVLNPGSSAFLPTKNRPGKLFGLDKENRIDFSLATISLRDAYYNDITNPDTGFGWLSLGKKGILYARFDLKNVDQYHSLFLFIGETGTGFEEELDLDVRIVE